MGRFQPITTGRKRPKAALLDRLNPSRLRASSPYQTRSVKQGRCYLHKWGITPTQPGVYHLI